MNHDYSTLGHGAPCPEVLRETMVEYGLDMRQKEDRYAE